MSDLVVRVQRRLEAVNEDRARLSRQALALLTARRRLMTGVDPRLVARELEIDPSDPMGVGDLPDPNDLQVPTS